MENKESFVELYTRLYNKNFKELEFLRKKEKRKSIGIILLVTVIMTYMFIKSPLLCVVLFNIFIIFFIIYVIKNNKKKVVGEKTYKQVFKEKIIAPIIKSVISKSKYSPRSGLNEIDYRYGKWESYDRYSTEDRIVMKINIKDNSDTNLQLTIAEVHTQDRHEDEEGHISYTTVFHGLAGYVDLPKDIACYIKVIKNQFNLFWNPKDRIKMDMTEFEKLFDVKTDDKIKAMQILTADVMTEMIDLVKASKVKFEFHIQNDIMYIRFHTGEVFEPEVFGKSMQLDKLKKHFDIINAVKNVTEHICNTVQNIEI